VNDVSIKLRFAQLDDADLLANLGATAFAQAFGADNTPEDMADYLQSSFSVDKLTEELSAQGSIFIIAEMEAGGAVGYARLLGNSTETCVTGERPIELVRIYVLQEWIGKKIGGMLMQACLTEARGRGYDVIWLGVWEKNERAIAFYQKWGFTKAGTHTFLLGKDLQHDWVMQQSLG